jgi:predicted DNA-binding transcriptional regulator YafY
MRGDRLLRLMLVLQSRGKMRVAELTKELEVSERTIYRDIEALSLSGVPIVTERGPGGGCYLVEGYTTRLTGLTEEETRALFAALAPGSLAPIGMDRALGGAVAKLAAALPLRLRESEASARGRIHIDLADPVLPAPGADAALARELHGRRGLLPAIREAVLDSRRLRIVRGLPYGPLAGARLELIVDALGLVASSRGWTLVAGIGGTAKAISTLDIFEAEALSEAFHAPEDFDLASFWSEEGERRSRMEASFSARIGIRPEAAIFLRARFGLGPELEIAAAAAAGRGDDQGRVEVELRFSAMEEALFLLPGFGSAVIVLGPEELRIAMEDRARAILGVYAG